MKLKQALGLIACIALPVAAYTSGCAGSNPSNSGDGATTGDGSGSSGSGTSSGGFSSSSTSGSSTGGSGSGTGGTGGSPSGSSSGTTSGADGGTACTPPATVTPPPPYQPVVQVKNACTSMQITQYLAACLGPSATAQTCSAFLNASTSNATCYGCISPESDAGARLGTGGFLPIPGTTYVTSNIPGCIAILDPANGPACAQAYAPLIVCDLEACTSAACVTDPTCQPQARMGACSTELADTQMGCAAAFADGGAGPACSSYTDSQVLNVICGTGM